MVHSKKKKAIRSGLSTWKPLQLNESLLSGGIDGLIGIEELTDYSLVLNKKRNHNYEEISGPNYKVVRVKAVGHSSKNVAADEDIPTEASKLDKKKKKKKINGISSTKVATIGDGDVPTETTLVEKKKKKRKNKKKKSPNMNSDSVNIAPGSGENNVTKTKKISKIKENQGKQKKQLEESPPEKLKNISKPAQLKRKHSVTEPVAKQDLVNKKRKTAKSTISLNANDDSKASSLDNKSVDKVSNKKSKKIKKKAAKKKSKTALPVGVNESIQSSTLAPVEGMEGWGGLNLPDSILRALAENGFTNPTEIQALSLPAAVLGRRDIMGAAETGSGKTLAFGIPILYGILMQKQRDAKDGSDEVAGEASVNNEDEAVKTPCDEPAEPDSCAEDDDIGLDEDGFGCVQVIDDIEMDGLEEGAAPATPLNPRYNHKLYALVLTPTRELAVQVKDHLAAAAKYTGIRVSVVIGGLAAQKQERLLRTKPEIVVATPGRLWELIQEGNSYLQQVDNISYLAIDETDRMTEKGHFQELHTLLERINGDEAQAKRRQNFVFSATLTMVHEPPQRRKGKKMRVTPGQKLQDVIRMIGITHPKIVDVTQKSGMSGTLEEARIRCSFSDKDIYLYYFLMRHPGRTLIFCNSISCVRRLAQLLTLLNCKPLPIHANMMQKQRLRNLDKFRDSPTGLLLATDVAARGLDIPNVQHVIHYQVPRTSETYVHRSGRTARASKEGLTLLLVEPDENQAYTRLCRTLGRAKELPDFKVAQDLFTSAKQRMTLAREIDQLELTSRRADAELGWFQKALTDMDMVLDKHDLPMRISKKETAGNRKVSAVKRKELASLLSRPLFAARK